MKALAIEMMIVLGIPLLLFQSNIIPLDGPFTFPIALLALAELIRLLYKFRQMRLQGINIADEGLKNPLLYSVNPRLGDFGYRWVRFQKPLLWVATGLLCAMAVLGTGGVLVLIAIQFGLIR